MGDRSKLPKWAQSELAVLENNVAYWKAAALAGPEESDTFLYQIADHQATGNLGRPLGDRPSILFGHDPFRVGGILVRRTSSGLLECRVGEGYISASPQSSNVLLLESRPGYART